MAHQAGATVGMTAGDANVIRRHRSEIWTAVQSGVDVFFANKSAPPPTFLSLFVPLCMSSAAAVCEGRLSPYHTDDKLSLRDALSLGAGKEMSSGHSKLSGLLRFHNCPCDFGVIAT